MRASWQCCARVARRAFVRRAALSKRQTVAISNGERLGEARSYSNANAAIGATNPSFRVFRCPFEKMVQIAPDPRKAFRSTAEVLRESTYPYCP